MGAAESLTGKKLIGQRRGTTWEVMERISQDPTLTPGVFSVGYRVVSEHGEEGFLKASDISMASSSPDPVQAMLDATTAHQFERSILDHCRGNRLDKIVTAVDFGSIGLIYGGSQDIVFYIVFELAKGDLREFVLVQSVNDLLWHITAIHNLTIAINQLHTSGIYHNDFKPGNALVFDNTEKVADLGRATSPSFPVAHEHLLCAGDRRFAPPEQLYPVENEASTLDKFIRSSAGDLYNLGSIVHYMITKRMLTPEIINRLHNPMKPKTQFGGWEESYEAALPYWRQAFSNVMSEFYDDLPEVWLQDFRFALDAVYDVVIHLCEPDFRLRGDLNATAASPAKYGLQKIISRMDFLRNKIIVKSHAR
jgi:serine/threonine protein kinase